MLINFHHETIKTQNPVTQMKRNCYNILWDFTFINLLFRINYTGTEIRICIGLKFINLLMKQENDHEMDKNFNI